MPETVRLHRLGLIPYREAWGWQRRTADAVRDGAPEALAILQHPHVYTFGRRVHPENLLAPAADAEVVESDRGGDVTYHGPGQLVAYPILNLHRRHLGAADYVRLLEEAMIRTAAAFNVPARRIPSHPGVWADPSYSPALATESAATSKSTGPLLARRGTRGSAGEVAKLGAVGVRVQRGVTTHGLALNIDPDLTRYDAIVPCGLTGIAVTSLAHHLGYPLDIEAAEDALLVAFEAVFRCHLQPTPTQSTHTAVVRSPSPQGGEGRAPALRMVEGAARERLNAPSLSIALDGHLPHSEPSRQRGVAIRGGATQQPNQPTLRRPHSLSSQARPSRSGRGEGRAAAQERFPHGR